MVSQAVTPQWPIVLGTVGPVVADAGGILSHAAIVAREHGIPAVVGTRDAPRRLVDGQLATVDGTSGQVHVER